MEVNFNGLRYQIINNYNDIVDILTLYDKYLPIGFKRDIETHIDSLRMNASILSILELENDTIGALDDVDINTYEPDLIEGDYYDF